MSTARCSARVYDGMWPRDCRNPAAFRIGYRHFCGIHNPERVPTEKQAAVIAARKAKEEAEAARERLNDAAPAMLAALRHVLERATLPGFLRDEVKAAIAKVDGRVAPAGAEQGFPGRPEALAALSQREDEGGY